MTAYWIVPGRLMAGEYPGGPNPTTSRVRLESLLGAGIRAFLDLTEGDDVPRGGRMRPYEEELPAVATAVAAEVSHARFPIQDFGVPTPGFMMAILDALDATLARGTPTYVHCLAGRGRTGAVVGCYLVRHAERLLGTTDNGQAGELALARVTELRVAQRVPFAEDSPQTAAQREFVLKWRPGW